MEKRKLNKRQLIAIKKQQAEKRQRAEQHEDATPGKHDNEQTGLLVSHYGQQIEIEDANAKVRRCVARSNLGSIAVGDNVIWCPEQNGPDVIVAVEPRRSELFRYHKFDGNKLVAANIDQLYIVVAAEPARAMNVIDRYLMLAEIQNIQPVLVFNKTDLLDTDDLTDIKEFLAYYSDTLGYRVFYTSSKTATGIAQLTSSLTDKTSIFVGLSGVGKSSLIQSLLPNESLAIGELSERSREGNHTTTTAKLFHLPEGGNLIDCPGIRELAVGKLSFNEVLQGFPDFANLANECQFRDCSHSHEPGCAIQVALNNQSCNPDRWASLQNILAEVDTFSGMK